jgi:hypothetical protein
MSSLIDQLREVGNALDHCNPGENPERARALLKRRKELRHQAEAARDRSIAYQAREQARATK